MAIHHELMLSERDLGELSSALRAQPEAGAALADLFEEARRVPHERLPGDVVAMNARVTYREEPVGDRRTVMLVHPRDADASAGRVSVLSPVGRSLLGRREGAVIDAAVPGGKALRLRLLEVERRP